MTCIGAAAHRAGVTQASGALAGRLDMVLPRTDGASGQDGRGAGVRAAVAGPAGSTVEWDADITEDRPNELIAWRSVEGADVQHSGVVRFEAATGNRGTMVIVEMQYAPPGGTLGSAVAAWFGEDPPQSIKMDLRRFKQVMETGEAITTEGQPAGRADSISWKYDSATRR